MVHAQLQQPVDLCDSEDEDVKAKDTETEPSGEQTESKMFCDNGYWGTYEGELNKGGLRHGKGKMKWDVETGTRASGATASERGMEPSGMPGAMCTRESGRAA